jgi:hypothetical protein
MLTIAAVMTAFTAEYPTPRSWELPGITLGIYAVALSLLLAVPPGVGASFALTISAILGIGAGLLAFQIWAFAQGEVSAARDRQVIWLAAVACIANLSLLLAALRYMLAVKERLRWWHIALGGVMALPPAWILMARFI